jgi:uncharacterized membrane protein
MDAPDGWEPGPVGQEVVPGGADPWFHLDVTPLRRAARFLMWSALAGFAALVALAVLVAAVIPHTVLVVVLIVLAVPVVLLALAVSLLVWVARRAWRNGTWTELVPMAVGVPLLGRLTWAGRALLVGRALWRLVRRPRGASRRSARGASAYYQAYPGGPWHQARAGDLSGTTR